MEHTMQEHIAGSRAPQRRGGIGVGFAAIVTAVVALLAFGGGFFIGQGKVDTSLLPASVSSALGINTQQPDGVDLAPVWKAWHILDEKFVPAALGTTTATTTDHTQDRVWGMIQGLAASLGDPYTVFMPPAEAQSFQEDISGTFEGVGMEIDVVDGILTVVSPLKGTPAYRAGIQAQDKVLEIDGESTAGMDTGTAVKKIRGPRGSTVVLTILHDGAMETEDISVVRDVINIPTIKTEARKDGIFVIELYSFTSASPQLFRDALQEFANSGNKKLILDLRGNPGGYLDAAVDMASWFLESGKPVVTEDYGSNGEPVVHRSRGYNVFPDTPLVILVNGGSASASEILAGALRAYNKATLVGTNTFGKGSVQELVPITKDTSLKVTVARWILPDNSWIQRTGIEPDIEAERTREQYLAGEDPQLDRAVEFLKTGQ